MSREGGSDKIAFLKPFQSRVRSSRDRVQRQDLKEDNYRGLLLLEIKENYQTVHIRPTLYKMQWYVGNRDILTLESSVHLGVALSRNAKWTIQVEGIPTKRLYIFIFADTSVLPIVLH